MDATQEGKIRPFEMIFDFVTATTEFQIHTWRIETDPVEQNHTKTEKEHWNDQVCRI
jgi:hypothetical protein